MLWHKYKQKDQKNNTFEDFANLQNTCVIETGLSDLHLMKLTVMRKNFKKIKPRIINYRSHNNFSNEYYGEYLFNALKREPLPIIINDLKSFVT